MRLILVLLAAFAPTALLASGTPSRVHVPCYPQGPLDLCAVPDVDVHGPNYLPRTTPTDVRIYPSGNRFVVLVTPNVAPYEYAVQDAARAALAYCGTEPGERIAARIDGRQRYAEENLESWRFSGGCE